MGDCGMGGRIERSSRGADERCTSIQVSDVHRSSQAGQAGILEFEVQLRNPIPRTLHVV